MKKILIVGFGTVGQGFFELFHEKKSKVNELKDAEIAEILDMKLGYEKNPTIDTLDRLKSGARLSEKPRDVLETLDGTDADIVCEFTWVNMKDGEPAFSHMNRALERGKKVITTNKGPIALHYGELQRTVSSKRGSALRFKGTVMSGTPSYNVLDLLPGIDVKRVRGILNGTSNYIMSEMAGGSSFDESLKRAQAEGYAEADPTMDIDGYDAALKAMIISNVLGWSDAKHSIHGGMEVGGIRSMRQSEVSGEGWKAKLVVTIDRNSASVKVTRLESGDLLSNVDGVLNALELETDTLGKVVMIGPGAGRKQTAQAALTDLVDIVREP